MTIQLYYLVWFFLCHVFNFLDAVLTLAAISHGVEEANPVMAWALSISPVFFLLVKFVIFGAASWYIFHHAPRLLAPIGIMFAAVLLWHGHFWLIM
tara:strand:- start:282 stop:569 length:288 start_codon:yes stop_codon:yes gene_type:complete